VGCLIGILGLFFLFVILWGFSVSPILGILLAAGVFGGMIYLANLDNKKQSRETNEKVNKLHDMQMAIKDFTVSQKFTSPDIKSALLLDEENKKVAFIYVDSNDTQIYNYEDILEAEILEDGKTITSTSRSSQIGGALIGGALAGGVGAIVGGLSGKQSSEQEINRIDLKVIVNNTKQPVKIINFLNAYLSMDINGKPFPIKKEDASYKSAHRTVNHWHSLLSLLIKQTDNTHNLIPEEKPVVTNNLNVSVADEIKKLSELLAQGLLTQEEYNQQKTKLLS
jgi:Short C-terminal domain